MRLKVSFVFLAVLAVLVAGCGGGGDSTGGGTADGSGATSAQEKSSTNGETSGEDSSGEEDTSGGEDGTSGEEASENPLTSGPLTKAEFVKQGDEICKAIPAAYQEKLQALQKESKGKKLTKAEEAEKAAVPPLYTAAEELEALEPPSGEEQKVEAMIDALEAAAKGVEKEPTAELSGPKSPFAEFQKLTREYGFKFCSQL